MKREGRRKARITRKEKESYEAERERKYNRGR